MSNFSCRTALAAVLWTALAGAAFAKLPPPTPAQEQAAADKKAQAAAQADEEKKQLSAAMDKVAAYWRERASKNGWKTHPATAITEAKKEAVKQEPQPPIRSEKAGTAPPSRDVKPDKPVSIR